MIENSHFWSIKMFLQLLFILRVLCSWNKLVLLKRVYLDFRFRKFFKSERFIKSNEAKRNILALSAKARFQADVRLIPVLLDGQGIGASFPSQPPPPIPHPPATFNTGGRKYLTQPGLSGSTPGGAESSLREASPLLLEIEPGKQIHQLRACQPSNHSQSSEKAFLPRVKVMAVSLAETPRLLEAGTHQPGLGAHQGSWRTDSRLPCFLYNSLRCVSVIHAL